jgi:hypothetical protein
MVAMITFTKTRTAADYISRHTSSDLTRSRALVLLTRLGVREAALATADGDPGLAYSLLRGLVLTVEELTGPARLAANTGAPDIAAFTALGAAPALLPRPTSMSFSPGAVGPLHTRPAVTVARQRPGPACGIAVTQWRGRPAAGGKCHIPAWRLFSRPRRERSLKPTAITMPWFRKGGRP